MLTMWFANFGCPEVLQEIGGRTQHFLLFSPNGCSTFLRRFVFGELVCLFYSNCARIMALSYLPTLTMGPCSLSRKSLLIKESNILYALFFASYCKSSWKSTSEQLFFGERTATVASFLCTLVCYGSFYYWVFAFNTLKHFHEKSLLSVLAFLRAVSNEK